MAVEIGHLGQALRVEDRDVEMVASHQSPWQASAEKVRLMCTVLMPSAFVDVRHRLAEFGDAFRRPGRTLS